MSEKVKKKIPKGSQVIERGKYHNLGQRSESQYGVWSPSGRHFGDFDYIPEEGTPKEIKEQIYRDLMAKNALAIENIEKERVE